MRCIEIFILPDAIEPFISNFQDEKITENQYFKGYYYKKFQKVEIRYELKQNNFQIQVLCLNMCI